MIDFQMRILKKLLKRKVMKKMFLNTSDYRVSKQQHTLIQELNECGYLMKHN